MPLDTLLLTIDTLILHDHLPQINLMPIGTLTLIQHHIMLRVVMISEQLLLVMLVVKRSTVRSRVKRIGRVYDVFCDDLLSHSRLLRGRMLQRRVHTLVVHAVARGRALRVFRVAIAVATGGQRGTLWLELERLEVNVWFRVLLG